jgi:hypothetical protein
MSVGEMPFSATASPDGDSGTPIDLIPKAFNQQNELSSCVIATSTKAFQLCLFARISSRSAESINLDSFFVYVVVSLFSYCSVSSRGW